MIEINGWVTLCNNTNGEDNYNEGIKVLNQLESIILPLLSFNQILEIKNINGNNVLIICLNHNHDNGSSDSIYKLLFEIGKIATGSYGLVYVRDHENGSEFNNFKVIKLAKGKVTFENDKLLSPCNPIIED